MGGAETAGRPVTPPYIPLVRSMTIERMPELLDRMNVRFDRLLRQAGLPEIRLDENTSFLPLRDVLAIADGAARATGIEHFSLMLAAAGGLDALGDYGTYIKSAPTLLGAMQRAGRYISWHTLGAQLSLRSEGPLCVWRYDLPLSIRENRQHGYPFALVQMREIVRLAAGRHWLPRELRLEQPPSASYRRALVEEFGPRIRCEAGENALVLDKALLGMPLAGSRTNPAAPSCDAAAVALASGTPSAEFIKSLRLLIRSYLPAGYPRAARLARDSGLSLRSFQRALALAGYSFSEIVDQVRFEMATEMMQRAGTRLIDVCLELGYSDAANFTRAFRRWTGTAPRAYRSLSQEREPSRP